MQKTVFKYRINEMLNKLTVIDYRKALLLIPKLLNVSQKTFSNYRKIKFDDAQDIPHEKVALLEKLFDIEAGELQNFIFVTKPLSTINEQTHVELVKVKRK